MRFPKTSFRFDYPNYKITQRTQLPSGDFKNIQMGLEILTPYAASAAACKSLKQCIEDKIQSGNALTAEEKKEITNNIRLYEKHLQTVCDFPGDRFARNAKSELLTIFGGVTELILAAPVSLWKQIYVTDLCKIISYAFLLGDTKSKHPLMKIIKLCEYIRNRTNTEDIRIDLLGADTPNGEVYTQGETDAVEKFKFQVNEKFKSYLTKALNQCPFKKTRISAEELIRRLDEICKIESQDDRELNKKNEENSAETLELNQENIAEEALIMESREIRPMKSHDDTKPLEESRDENLEINKEFTAESELIRKFGEASEIEFPNEHELIECDSVSCEEIPKDKRRAIDEKEHINSLNEAREIEFQNTVKLISENERARQKYFELNKGNINQVIKSWGDALFHRLNAGKLNEDLARDLFIAMKLVSSYCDFYSAQAHWFKRNESALSEQIKKYLSGLVGFADESINALIKANEPESDTDGIIDFEIDKESFISIAKSIAQNNVNEKWIGFLPEEEDKSSNQTPDEERVFVPIEVVLPRSVYLFEMLTFTFAKELVEQITRKNDELLKLSSLKEEGAPLSQSESANVAIHTQEEHATTTGDPAEVIIVSACDQKEAQQADVATVTEVSSRPQNPHPKKPEVSKNENDKAKKEMLNARQVRKLLHPDAFDGDIRKLSYPGGEIFLNKEQISIGHLWQNEDRRNTKISYGNSVQPEVYTLFTNKIIDDLRKQLTVEQYTSLLITIQARGYLRQRYKAQGIIKIRGDNAYEMRLRGGEREYRLMLQLNSIQNSQNLFLSKTNIYFVTKVFFHNGKTDKTIAEVGSDGLATVIQHLAEEKIYINPSLTLH